MDTDKLRTLKVMFFDADGVFFTGHETRTTYPDGSVLVTKTRFYPDGQGLSFLRHMGIKIVFVTGEGEPLDSIVKKINGLPSVQSGLWEKVEIFSKQNAKGQKLHASKHGVYNTTSVSVTLATWEMTSMTSSLCKQSTLQVV